MEKSIRREHIQNLNEPIPVWLNIISLSESGIAIYFKAILLLQQFSGGEWLVIQHFY